MTKQLNLFSEECGEVYVKRTKKQVYEDYDAFCMKFNSSAPKTTDDCYTPQPVYDAVLEWLRSQVNIEGRSIIRPFYPGGDYKNEEYPENCVVVDNPPFSILSEIVRFYIAAKIDFFLFAPGLTLFNRAQKHCTAIVTATQVVYTNGAVVNTGFLTSLFPGIRIIISTTLSSDIRRAMSRSVKGGKVVNCYPDNFVTAALLERAVGGGEDLVIYNSECEAVRELDAMKAFGKEAYGGGYLLSSSAAQRVSAAKANNARVVKWELSPRELRIIEKLDAQNNTNDNST